MSDIYPCSVVLAAHGSLESDNANEPLFELAEAIADSKLFACVTPAFLNGRPSLTEVYGELPPGDVVVIPVMTSEGYYSKTILPGKIAENRAIAENKVISEYRTFWTPALGVHPDIAAAVADRVLILTALMELKPTDTTIVVVGHGTSRHPRSGDSTRQLAANLGELIPEWRILTGFIDQEPSLAEIIEPIETPHRLVLPFLISRGPHAVVDVPTAFGLPSGSDVEFPLVNLVGAGITICDLPIGMYPEMAGLCIELATDALLERKPVDWNEMLKSK